MASFLDEEISIIAKNLNIYLNNKQLSEFNLHGRLLETWGRKMNLTAINESTEVVQRHFREGIIAGERLRQCFAEGPFLDLGSGNGFPAVPMAVVCRQARPLILVESSQKRAAFLRALIRDLGWENARVESRRVTKSSDLADLRCRVFTSRGVAISQLLREGLPFLESGGWCVLFGSKEELRTSLEGSSSNLELQEEVRLPSRESAILLLRKSQGTTPVA